MVYLSRRNLVKSAGAGALGAAMGTLQAPPQTQSKPPSKPSSKPEKAPPNDAASGRPVSKTAAAQEGTPVVPPPPKPRVRFALVGLGKLMIEEILPAIRHTSDCEISALVTRDREKGVLVAASLGLDDDRVIGYDELARLRDDNTIDAVYIATPNAMHRRDAVAALEAGKHVLCEKPMATTPEDAAAMIAAAEKADRKLMIAYRVHHEPINRAIKDMVRARTYGEPRFVTFDATLDVGSEDQYRLKRDLAGGGSLFDIGIYALNTTCWLLDEEPTHVSAMQLDGSGDSRFNEVEGFIAFQLRFPSGCIANCTSSYGTARVNRYRVICSKGWMGMEPATHYRGLHGEHANEKERSVLLKPESLNQFAAEFDHFAKAVRDGGNVESPGREGARDVALMLKIYEAAASGTTLKV